MTRLPTFGSLHALVKSFYSIDLTTIKDVHFLVSGQSSNPPAVNVQGMPCIQDSRDPRFFNCENVNQYDLTHYLTVTFKLPTAIQSVSILINQGKSRFQLKFHLIPSTNHNFFFKLPLHRRWCLQRVIADGHQFQLMRMSPRFTRLVKEKSPTGAIILFSWRQTNKVVNAIHWPANGRNFQNAPAQHLIYLVTLKSFKWEIIPWNINAIRN